MQAVSEGAFRSDFLYRINSFEIHLPLLRERREDIEPLARYLLQKIAGANAPEIAPAAVDALCSYSWSGNVRQLRNCLERAVLLADNGRITTKELPPEVVYKTNEPSVSVSYNTAKENGATNSFQNSAPAALHEIEKQQILRVLEQTGWHRGKTAELLGISSSTLYRRLREHDLETR
ncbi:MAG: helix-turn-helix domain-containing protein [Acidobacteriota bacterium]|nr:helix-turn-helix domain-containing protein [Acidobacteriota bacterium]